MAARKFPYVTTEIAFATSPTDVVPVWTDVSQYVKEIHPGRGRSNPLEDVDAGTCNYILDNRDRRFEPLYSSGPYYPNIKPLKRIRSWAYENPLTDSDFEDQNVAGAWVGYQGAGSLAIPAYGAAPTPVFGDNKLQVNLGPGPGFTGAQQIGVAFRQAFVTGEYVGFSIYVWASRAGSITMDMATQGGVTFGSSPSDLTPNAWTRVWTYGIIPAGTTSLSFRVSPTNPGISNWVAGDIIYLDGAQAYRYIETSLANIPSTFPPYSKTIFIFDGYVEGWPQIWPGGMQAEAKLDCVDGYKPLAPMQVRRGAYNLVVMDDLPTWYFRLGEHDSSQSAQNEAASGIQDGIYNITGGSPILSVPQSVIVGEYDTAVKFTGAQGNVRKSNVVVPTRQFAFEVILQADTAIPPGGTLGDQYTFFAHGDTSGGGTPGTIIQLGFNYLNATGGVPYAGLHPFIYINTAGLAVQSFIPNPLNTAAYWTSPHLLSVSWDGTGKDGNQGWFQVWLDGVQVDLTLAANKTYSQNCNTASGNSAKIARPYLGKLLGAGSTRDFWIGNDLTNLFGLRNVTLDEVAYWVDKIPPVGWAARHFAAFQYGVTVEDSGARMSHLLDQASVAGVNPWPVARRQIDVGVSQVMGFRWNEEKLIDLIRQDTKSEGGLFFFSGRGHAVFLNRWHTIQYPTCQPKGTLTDHPNPAQQLAPYEDVGSGGLDYDDQDIWNDVRVARFSSGYGDASGQQMVSDAQSQLDYMVHTLSLDDSIVTTDEEALNSANWYLYLYKNPGLKAKSVALEPMEDPTNLWRIISQTDLNDRLTVIRYPPPGTVAKTFEVLVMGIKHDIAPGEWHVTYDIYPAPPRDFWQLPASATNDPYAQFSILGVTTRLSY